MALGDVEKDWADRARRFLKAELKRAEISYSELARPLNAKVFQILEASIGLDFASPSADSTK